QTTRASTATKSRTFPSDAVRWGAGDVSWLPLCGRCEAVGLIAGRFLQALGVAAFLKMTP
ncbi:MAG: hypothetical protein J0L81_07955, partial [Caulobacterales bacterium]|nr:hypothetical protein [Caulobacterales bacterium]